MNRDNNLQLLRDDRGDQSLRRAAAAALRLLLPGLDRSDEVRHEPVSRKRRHSISSISARSSATSVRMLDNVLEVTAWPLEQQRKEAMAKRRVGLGFTGLGDALIMLRLRYDTDEARAMAARISEAMRDHAYRASAELAQERGAFPLFNADLYLSGTSFATRLPEEHQEADPEKRACATPTCCRSRPPAPSASPSPTTPPTASSRRSPGPTRARSACPTARCRSSRSRTTPGAATRRSAATSTTLPPYFVTALEITAAAHEQMVAAVAPFIDTSISKTVNVPEDYPYAEFQDLYLHAWKSGLKGLATYRPNKVLGSVLSVQQAAAGFRAGRRQPPHHRSRSVPAPVLASLRWPGRPELAARQPGVDLHDRAPAAPLRGVRRPRRERRARTPSRSG